MENVSVSVLHRHFDDMHTINISSGLSAEKTQKHGHKDFVTHAMAVNVFEFFATKTVYRPFCRTLLLHIAQNEFTLLIQI